MVVAAFVAPYLLEATARFVRVAAELPDVRIGLVTCEPVDRIPPDLRERLAAHRRGGDPRHPPAGRRRARSAAAGLGGERSVRAAGPGRAAGRRPGAAAGPAGAGQGGPGHR